MVDGQAGKGDRYRRVDRKKYDESYDRIFGKECSQCIGSGVFAGKPCASCGGTGRVKSRGDDK